MATYNEDVAEVGTAADTHTGATLAVRTATDTFTLGPETLIAGWVKVILDGPIVAGDATVEKRFGPLIEDLLTLVNTSAVEANYGKVLTENARFVEALRAAFPKSTSDTMNVTDAIGILVAIVVLDRLGLLPAVTGASTLTPAMVETLGLSESLANFFGVSASDGIGMESTLLRQFTAHMDEADEVTVGDAPTAAFVLRVTAADEFEIAAEDALSWVFAGVLADGVQLSAAFILPGSSITTWAINTRSGGVTEYSNYAFNSFAQMGNVYFAASEDGLYELTGDDDAGTDIIADIKSGLFQFGGAHLASLKGVYLATRGGGQFVLKIQTGDGKEYVYDVLSNDMQTTKIQIGKGLRSRYFAYELVSTGQDFDLESLEFIPLVAARRI